MKKKLISLMYTMIATLFAVPALATQSAEQYFKQAGVTSKDLGTSAANFVKNIVAPVAGILGFVGLITIAVWFFSKIMTAKDARERAEIMSNLSWKLIGAIGLCFILTVAGFLVWLLGKLKTI